MKELLRQTNAGDRQAAYELGKHSYQLFKNQNNTQAKSYYLNRAEALLLFSLTELNDKLYNHQLSALTLLSAIYNTLGTKKKLSLEELANDFLGEKVSGNEIKNRINLLNSEAEQYTSQFRPTPT